MAGATGTNRSVIRTPPPHDPEPGWAQSLYQGGCGIALLHIERVRTEAGDWTTAHRWAAAITRNPVTAHPDACGLGRGAPAVAFTLHAADHPAYASALTTLDAHISTLTRERLRCAHERVDAGRRPALREFDLIRGLTGVGVYLLHRHRGGDLLRDVLSYLVRLAEPIRADNRQTLPGWWSDNAPNDQPSEEWPGGHGNFGMAHGIAGPIALMSAAMRRGITVPGQADAIGRTCEWLDRWRSGTECNAWWPEMICAVELRSGAARQAGPGRPSWCYGTPGLARAQQLAGLALGDTRRQQIAEQALAGCVADEQQLAQLRDASLCHGWAGLLQTAWRVAADSDDSDLFDVIRLRKLLDQHVKHAPPAQYGLLEGMAGVHLARDTVAAGVAPASSWDACLLLDGGRI
jgi:hypothetical protein